MGPTAGLNRRGNCHPPWDSISTIQLVVSCHTDYAVPAHSLVKSDVTSVEDVKCLVCPLTSKTYEMWIE